LEAFRSINIWSFIHRISNELSSVMNQFIETSNKFISKEIHVKYHSCLNGTHVHFQLYSNTSNQPANLVNEFNSQHYLLRNKSKLVIGCLWIP
jgi:hypothetical protein